jgi:hypothetical protein
MLSERWLIRLTHCRVFCLLFLGIFVFQAKGQVSFFTNPPTFAAGRGNVFAADLNLDGSLDLVYADGTVLLGKGDGTFKVGTQVGLAPGTSIVGEADFNGDGRSDLLGVNGFNLLVFLGNGDGTFQSPTSSFVAASYASFFVGDVNGDGKPDALGFNPNAGFTVFLGKGDGTLTISQSYSISTGLVMVAGDFNGDHKLDVAVASSAVGGTNPTGSVAVLLGNGDGTFKNPVTSAGVFNPSVMVVGNVNGDGKLDLVLATAYPLGNGGFQTAATLLGNGDGTFQPPSQIAPPPPATVFGVSGTELVLADVNGDGRLDLVVSSLATGFVQILLGKGDGISFSLARSYYLLNEGGHITVADFNNDHKLDIACGPYMLLGNGDGSFHAPQNLETRGGVAVGDFNGDGIADLAGVLPPNLDIYLGNRSGVLSLAHSYNFSQLGDSILAADVNGDGKLDLVTWGNGGVAVVLGNGDGTFQSPIVSSGCTPGINWAFGVGDFNNDHKLDLAFVQNSLSGNGNSLYLCLGNGDGSFAALSSVAFAGTTTNSLALGDFNKDGNLDAAVGSKAGLAILLGKGDGTFQAPNFIIRSVTYVTAPADYNGDGNVDLVVGPNAFNSSGVFLGRGDGTFRLISQTNLPFPATPVDVNGDGKLDLVGIGGGDGVGTGLQVSLGNGDGTFGAPIVLAIGTSHVQNLGSPNIGDFNGDKLPDLAVPWGQFSGYDGGVAIFLNTTPPGGTTDMGLSVASGGSGSVTVPAGQPASYTLSIGGKGWSGQASLSCSGAPSGASCSVAPSTLTVSAINPSPLTVSVITTPRTMSALRANPKLPSPWIWATALMAILILPGSLRSTFPASKLIRRMPLLLLFLLCSCGGGSGGSSQHGTPAGTYTLIVTATSGSLSQSLPLTLTVQ